ncbi:MAG TPA: hypothetical protein VGR46_03190 [Candidatus Limnocylindria bacterium]|nr:hypothetical protein [Candidatus Limnocylindria bacterium]
MREEHRATPPLATALSGLVLGVIAVPLLVRAGPFAVVPFAALVALVTLRRDPSGSRAVRCVQQGSPG